MAIAALIMSIIALVIALRSIAQMAWGKADLEIGFDVREVEGGRVLICRLRNAPIITGFKRKIGIRRMPIEDLMARFSIAETGSNKVIYPGKVPCILRHDGVSEAQRVSLPASIFPAHFGVASVDYNAKSAKVFGEDIKLSMGEYMVKVNAGFQEEHRDVEQILVVHKEYPYAYWR